MVDLVNRLIVAMIRKGPSRYKKAANTERRVLAILLTVRVKA
mgnify:CR=1 FL=1